MFENAIYSVLSPEGFAVDPVQGRFPRQTGRRGHETHRAKIFSRFGVIDQIIPGPGTGLHEDYAKVTGFERRAHQGISRALQRRSVSSAARDSVITNIGAIGLAAAEIDVFSESEEPQDATHEEPVSRSRRPAVTFPSKIVTNQDMEKIVDTTDEWIYTRTGIKNRRFVETNGYLRSGGARPSRPPLRQVGIRS
ncbi:MAG: hypothetical protein MZU97_05145 [Bacillus subtilis]|nr:hypothetical protein [Bacillus subtilis]